MEVFTGVAQAATQTTPENERVSFVPNSKPKNKMPLKIRSNSKNGLKTAESVPSTESKYNQQETIVQEPKLVERNIIYYIYVYVIIYN